MTKSGYYLTLACRSGILATTLFLLGAYAFADDPPPGAPWYYWVYVLFDSNGERIKIHLKKGQAKKFVDVSAEGDTGYLDFKGDRMYTWERTREE